MLTKDVLDSLTAGDVIRQDFRPNDAYRITKVEHGRYGARIWAVRLTKSGMADARRHTQISGRGFSPGVQYTKEPQS